MPGPAPPCLCPFTPGGGGYLTLPSPSTYSGQCNTVYIQEISFARNDVSEKLISSPLLIDIHVLMRDEKEGRKKQARSNKQTRQSNTYSEPHFLRKSDCLGCAALLYPMVCLFDLALSFLPSFSHLSLKHVH